MTRLSGYNAKGLPGYDVRYNGHRRSAQVILIDPETLIEVFRDGALIGKHYGRDIDPDLPPEGLPKRPS